MSKKAKRVNGIIFLTSGERYLFEQATSILWNTAFVQVIARAGTILVFPMASVSSFEFDYVDEAAD